jgi:hypothetical protein
MDAKLLTFELKLGSDKQKISDIEALAGVSGDKVLAFASYSRNTNCEIKPNRHKFGKVNMSKKTTEVVVETLPSNNFTCANLFAKRVADMDAPMKAACEAIDAADLLATLIDDAVQAKNLIKDKDSAEVPCNAVNAFNAEGAVAIGTDVWIGLRAPLLPAHPSQPEKKIWPSCST